MISAYLLGLVVMTVVVLVFVACKLLASAAALGAVYNAFWMGAVFASGNGFAFGYEPETIATLDGQWLILMALPLLVVCVISFIAVEVRIRRKLPKKPKESATIARSPRKR